ncbi:MAG: hypothetical protein CMJ90_11040 [Planctomycetes bacterium]|nr:hypothetical protein [Planctomycetota bacterium]
MLKFCFFNQGQQPILVARSREFFVIGKRILFQGQELVNHIGISKNSILGIFDLVGQSRS